MSLSIRSIVNGTCYYRIDYLTFHVSFWGGLYHIAIATSNSKLLYLKRFILKDALQRDTMIDDFKKSFQPKPKPKKVVKVVKQKPADGSAADTAGGGGNMEHLQGDLRTLVTRFLDPKVGYCKEINIYINKAS